MRAEYIGCFKSRGRAQNTSDSSARWHDPHHPIFAEDNRSDTHSICQMTDPRNFLFQAVQGLYKQIDPIKSPPLAGCRIQYCACACLLALLN